MVLFILLFVCGIVTFEDLGEFWGDILNVKYGTLQRLQYFACTWVSTAVISFIGNLLLSNLIINGNVSFKSFEYLFPYSILYLIITMVHLSAFLRRMNDAQLSHWYALVFLIPGIGNIIGFIIALLPSDFGSAY